MEFSGMEKLSLVDFDHNLTATLFMAGCPFRCPFCHNGDLVLFPEKAPIIPFEDILAYLRKRQGVLEAVCISGGEPTLMEDLEEKIRAIRELDYKIKLDSNGCNPGVLADLIGKGLIDYIAMDIKNSKEKYNLTCGAKVDLAKIGESVKLLMTSGIAYEFRTTVIEEFHTEEDIREIGEWIKGADRYFLQKYVDGDSCIRHNYHAISDSEIDEFLQILRPYIPNVAKRGYFD